MNDHDSGKSLAIIIAAIITAIVGPIVVWYVTSQQAQSQQQAVQATVSALQTQVSSGQSLPSQQVRQPSPTLTSILPTRVLTVQATATPRPSIREYVTISPQRETRHISLGAGELIVGTAVYFQDNFDQRLPPFTVFLIRGPIEMDVTIENGGWDHWANVYDDAFMESLLAPKIKEVQQHPDYSIRGYRVVRLP